MQEMREMQVRSLGWENPLKEEIATHSSIRAWKISQTEKTAAHNPLGHKKLDTAEWLNTQYNVIGGAS